MAKSESFDSVLQALRLAWLRGCEASAVQFLAASSRWTTASAGGFGRPSRLVVRAPACDGRQASTAEFDLADLCRHVWMQPASLTLSFVGELRPRQDGAWQLHLVRRGRNWWWSRKPRHEVEIVIEGALDAAGEVRFDGRPWRRFGPDKIRRPP